MRGFKEIDETLMTYEMTAKEQRFISFLIVKNKFKQNRNCFLVS
jgi:hypothetical protein